MSKKKQQILEQVRLEKFVHGGQCIAHIEGSDKPIFVFGGLPGEIVTVRVTKKKSSYREGIVTEVVQSSEHRIEPLEPESYLSTSPWQIMDFEYENDSKLEILNESFSGEGVDVSFDQIVTDGVEYGYRNKMEFGFWGDDEGLHLAHFRRGSHGKVSVNGSVLAMTQINEVARLITDELNRLQIWGGDLKTLIIRASQNGDVVAALFTKKEDLDISNIAIPDSLQGLKVYYSNPQSPASVITKELYSFGDITLHDTLMDKNIMYDVNCFFQVNLPVFSKALTDISEAVGSESSIDFYTGTGSIGVPIGSDVLVDSDESNTVFTEKNAIESEVITAPAEKVVEYIDPSKVLIVDPPRAGLHTDVIDEILAKNPPKIVYLSCNPATQVRDVKLLEKSYKITKAKGYNFFPRTPHIESLVVLERI